MLSNLFSKINRGEAQPANRRREAREDVPEGTVEIDGRTYPVANWSYSGFLAGSYTGDRKAGDRVDIKFTVDLGDGGTFYFACKCVMVRVDPETQKLVGAFVEMDAAMRAKLARHFG
jgi:hypothetical protein